MTHRLCRVPLLMLALLSMVWGVWLGLLRLGWILPLPWPDQLILHGPLMIGGFLGTLVGLERSIGLAKRWAYAAPVCSAMGALLLVFGPPALAGQLLITMGSAVVVIVFLMVMRRESSLFGFTMLMGTIAWFVGNVWWSMGAAIYRIVFWWVAFVVLTVAGERLELNRVLQPTARVRITVILAVAVLVTGVVGVSIAPLAGSRVMGVGLLGIAWWLARNDVATRTIRQRGLTRYMAGCLLAGYVWLAVAGVLLLMIDATSPGTAYDAVLHAIFVGFVVSMVFGHAPVIFPAILGRPLPFTRAFYVPLAILHASVAVRLAGDLIEVLGRIRAWGGLLNALTIALFMIAITRALATAPSGRRSPALASS